MKLSTFLPLPLLPLLSLSKPLDPLPFEPGTTGPDPTLVHIKDITYGGTGCPQGSMDYIISEDRTYVTLIFDQYVASIGPGVSVTQNRKNCQLNIDLLYPGGFQYSVFSADYRGYAAVDEGVTGTIKSTYYFSSQTEQTSTDLTFTGPLSGDYLKHDETDNTSIVWSPCGQEGMLNINSQIRLQSANSKAQGVLTTDSIDASFVQVVYVKWRECSKK